MHGIGISGVEELCQKGPHLNDNVALVELNFVFFFVVYWDCAN